MFKESDIILKTNHVVKQFNVSGNRLLTACNDINLNVYKGKTLGIVGESGCGKSTFVRMMMQMDEPTSGEILFHGKDIAHLSSKEKWMNRQNMQIVFQDPMASFNPKMKIIDILTEPLLNFKKIKKSEKEAKAKELLEMVELPADFMYRYPHNMSGGQRQRVSIARSLSLEPEILVCDEATSALCHDLALIQSFAHQIAVMYLGNVVEILSGKDVIDSCLHPYTKALLSAVFSIHMDKNHKIESIKGEAPSPLDLPNGCPFQNRCEHCMEKCKIEKPILQEINNDHQVACHYIMDNIK